MSKSEFFRRVKLIAKTTGITAAWGTGIFLGFYISATFILERNIPSEALINWAALTIGGFGLFGFLGGSYGAWLAGTTESPSESEVVPPVSLKQARQQLLFFSVFLPGSLVTGRYFLREYVTEAYVGSSTPATNLILATVLIGVAPYFFKHFLLELFEARNALYQ